MFENFRLNMLNKEAASPKNKPSEIIKSLNIQKGDIVGDIGTGGGYFSFEFSKEVGDEGKVYAIDTNKKSLDFIKVKSKEKGINNIKTVLADDNGLSLPEKADIFFLRNVFHHLPEPVGYFKNARQFLKDEGKIVIIDYKKRGFSFTGIFGHYTPEDDLIDIMGKAGFILKDKFDFLSEQSFIIFKIR
ncbi:MAG: class I SAM-dependent methyltransferase [Methanobacterium sp.]